MYVLGFDIGGTKCAVVTARWDGSKIELLQKSTCSTLLDIPPESMLQKLMVMADGILTEKPAAIGISCGGPLDSQAGMILGPPNLPGWEHVEIVRLLRERYAVPVTLQNDANACALAEWKFGAGRGCRNLVFLTFGTGLGAGLILDGKLYTGTNDNAGEVGHIRLAPTGPVGYGKTGSFEGFCSGGGLARLGQQLTGGPTTAKALAEAARLGDETAKEVFRTCARQLGMGLSLLIDVLNPEKIILGSIFCRCQDLLWPDAQEKIQQEALPAAAAVCRIVPAQLGEQIGDYAAIATAIL